MVYRFTLIASIILVFSAAMLIQKRLERPLRPVVSPQWQCRRIVSMAPSITETLYALGLGDRVVGVPRNCHYPPEVEDISRIGSYYDPNFEAIVALKPDLVIMLEENAESLPDFEKLNLETLVVSHQTLQGVIDSFRSIGRVCGKGPEGRRLAADYEYRLNRIADKTRNLPRPRVLMAIDRVRGRNHLADIYVVGDDDYFDRILELAGGQNAFLQKGVRYPVVSPEGISWLNPDVIVDLVYPSFLQQVDRQSVVNDWNELPQVAAVKNHRVEVLDQDYACVPGPRIILLVEELAKILHPEIDWDNDFGPFNP